MLLQIVMEILYFGKGSLFNDSFVYLSMPPNIVLTTSNLKSLNECIRTVGQEHSYIEDPIFISIEVFKIV